MTLNYVKVLLLGNNREEKLFLFTSLSEVCMIETSKVRVSCYQKYALWLVEDNVYYGGADKVIILNSSKGRSSLDWQDKVRKSLGSEVDIYHLYGDARQKLASMVRILS